MVWHDNHIVRSNFVPPPRRPKRRVAIFTTFPVVQNQHFKHELLFTKRFQLYSVLGVCNSVKLHCVLCTVRRGRGTSHFGRGRRRVRHEPRARVAFRQRQKLPSRTSRTYCFLFFLFFFFCYVSYLYYRDNGKQYRGRGTAIFLRFDRVRAQHVRRLFSIIFNYVLYASIGRYFRKFRWIPIALIYARIHVKLIMQNSPGVRVLLLYRMRASTLCSIYILLYFIFILYLAFN